MCCGCWILAGVLALFLIGVAVLCWAIWKHGAVPDYTNFVSPKKHEG